MTAAHDAHQALSMSTQCRLLLDYLQAGRTLTNLVAITNLGIGSLTSRIAELRKDYGYPVLSEWREDFGGKRYRAYWLAPVVAL